MTAADRPGAPGLPSHCDPGDAAGDAQRPGAIGVACRERLPTQGVGFQRREVPRGGRVVGGGTVLSNELLEIYLHRGRVSSG